MFKQKISDYVRKIRELNGDPHYVGLGMAIGVFIAITPTIPFHTIFAVALAVLLKASKPAAIMGVWVSNPITVVPLYLACYETGHLFFEGSAGAMLLIRQLIEHLESDIHYMEKIAFLTDFVKHQIRTFLIMNFGGLVLGLPAGAAVYFFTRRFFMRMRSRSLRQQG